jgi:GNAT superfamily N-acetyltransferase
MLDDYDARITAGEAWVLEHDHHPIGVLVLIDCQDHLLLDNIAVLPHLQGRGYGRQLLDFADDEAVRRGYCLLRLYTHALMHENVALYRALGWSEYARGTQSGYDRVFMEKHLPPA